jgi:hypothetical protein
LFLLAGFDSSQLNKVSVTLKVIWQRHDISFAVVLSLLTDKFLYRNQNLYEKHNHRASINSKQSYPLNRSWKPIGLQDLWIPCCPAIRLTEGGKVVSPTHWPSCTPRNIG